MNNFIITVDSSCEVSAEELAKLGIRMIYINYADGEKVYSSKMNEEENKKFYENMENGVVYKTSQINVQEYVNFFEPLLEENNNILHISLSAALSNTVNNAYLANEVLKETHPEANVIPVDSKIASLGVYIVVLEAYRLQQEGLTISEAFEKLNEFVKYVNTYYTTDDLTYFVRGGRLNKVTAFVGKVFKINPILDCMPSGQLRVVKNVRGRRRAIEYVIERIANTAIDPEKQTIYICHANCKERGQELADTLVNTLHFKDAKLYPMGPIIGAHAGPGLLAFFYTGALRTIEIKNYPENYTINLEEKTA